MNREQPDQLLGRMLYHRHDHMTAGLAECLLSFAEECEEHQDWDMPPAFFIIYRDLPPKDIADRFIGAGMQAMVLGLRHIELDLPMLGGAHLAKLMEALAEAMTGEDAEEAQTAFVADNSDLLAWVLVNEAYTVTTDNPQEYEEVERLAQKGPLRKHPKAIEVRVFNAVDRTGCRYQVTHERESGLVWLALDFRDQGWNEATLTGRLMDALAKLMEATPEGEPI